MSGIKIQVKRGSSSQWTSLNPVLAEGEIGLELDTNKIKFGKGGTYHWNDLPYFSSGSGSSYITSIDTNYFTLTNGELLLNLSGLESQLITDGFALKTYADNVASQAQSAAELYVDNHIPVAGTDYIAFSEKGIAGGVATLNGDGVLPASQINLTLQQVATNGSATTSFSNIDTIQFDEDSGFTVTGPTSNIAKIAMNSTFKYWKVDGVQKLTAVGLDTVNFISGSGITISGNGGVSPQTLTIGVTPNTYDAYGAASTAISNLHVGGTSTGNVVSIDGTQTLTNKTISGASNTISNIGNSSLTNSSISINGTGISLGETKTITAAAGTLTGNTLASGVTSSSLTSVGTLANLTVTNTITGSVSGNAGTVTNGVYTTDSGTVTNTMLVGSISDSKLLTISSVGKVANSATTATYENTASAIVARDSSGNFSANLITVNTTPTAAGHAASKAYVDNISAGMNWHAAVVAATAGVLPSSTYAAGTIDANGGYGIGATLTANANAQLTIDTVTVSNGNRVLIKNQADAKQNGIYVVTDKGSSSTKWVLTRATDADNHIIDQVAAGDAVYVLYGPNNTNQSFVATEIGSGTDGLVLIGTDNIIWTQFSGASNFVAGNGLVRTGNTVDVVSSTLSVTADSIDLAPVSTTTSTGNAYSQFVGAITVDSYGRVTNIQTDPLPIATSSQQGVATFNTASFAVTSGDVTIKSSGVSNSQLVNSTININGTAVSLGGSVSGLATNNSPTFTGTVTLPLTTAGYVTTTSDGVVSSVATIPNSGLTNSSTTIGTTNIDLGASSTTLAGLTSVSSTAFTGDLTGNVIGNADTATKLATARNINGVAFDGSAAITVKASTTNALTIGTGLSGSSFDGSGAVTIAIDSTVATLTGTQTLTNKTLTSPTVSFSNNSQIFVTITGTTRAASSTDSVTWTTRTLPTSNIGYLAYSNNLFVGVNNFSNTSAVSSTDGITWTLRTLPALSSLNAIAYGNGLFVAVGSGTILTTTDAVTWNSPTSPQPASWSSIIYANSKFLVASNNGSGNYLSSSTDGVTWTSISGPGSFSNYNPQALAYGNGVYVLTGSNSSNAALGTTYSFYSTDGINWNVGNGMPKGSWTSVAYGNGVFVSGTPINASGTNTLTTSTDGATWTARTSPSGYYVNAVTYGNGLFFAVQTSGTTAFTSTDGITWTVRTLPASASWLATAPATLTSVTSGSPALNNQTFYIGTQLIPINAASGSITTLPGVTSVNGTTIPNAATLLTSNSTSSSLTSFGSNASLTTPTIDIINSASATGTTASLYNNNTSGTISIAPATTSGTIQIGGAGTATAGTVNILSGATTSGTKAINIGTNGTTGSTTTITIGTTAGTTPTITLNGAVTAATSLASTGTFNVNGTNPTIATTATSGTAAIFNTTLTGGINLGQAVTGTINIGSGTATIAIAGTLTSPAVNSTSATTAMAIANTNTSANVSLATALTSGTFTIGGATAQTGQISIGNGATGALTIAIGNGVTTSGSTKTIQIGTSGAAGSTTAITIGSTTGTSTIALNGTVTPTTLTPTNALGPTYGGTGQTTYTTGDILYASGSNTLSKLSAGTANYVLTSGGPGVAPSWVAAAGGGASVTTSTVNTNTAFTIDTVALSGFTTMEYTLSLKQGTVIRSSKVFVQNNGTSVDYTEYAVMNTGGTLAGIAVAASLSSTNSILQVTVTNAATTNVTAKFTKVVI